tara:strand:- start:79 stop:219 length:141 start_codon:yes stop_codon:yes gene_type:complete
MDRAAEIFLPKMVNFWLLSARYQTKGKLCLNKQALGQLLKTYGQRK